MVIHAVIIDAVYFIFFIFIYYPSINVSSLAKRIFIFFLLLHYELDPVRNSDNQNRSEQGKQKLAKVVQMRLSELCVLL